MMITYSIVALFVAICVAVVGWPFIRARRGSDFIPVADSGLADLRGRRDRIYESLRDLEFDERTGKISHQDYLDLSDRYKRRAIGILKDLDESQRDALLALDQEVEGAVAAARATSKGELGTVAIRRTCLACGASNDPDDRFCRKCGTATKAIAACARCATPLRSGDAFCSACGTSV